jgi:hypothetical protein
MLVWLLVLDGEGQSFPTIPPDYCIMLEFGLQWPEVNGIKVIAGYGWSKTFSGSFLPRQYQPHSRLLVLDGEGHCFSHYLARFLYNAIIWTVTARVGFRLKRVMAGLDL